MDNGGEFVIGFFPDNFSEIPLKNRTKCNIVKKIRTQFCESGTTRFQGGSQWSSGFYGERVTFWLFYG